MGIVRNLVVYVIIPFVDGVRKKLTKSSNTSASSVSNTYGEFKI